MHIKFNNIYNGALKEEALCVLVLPLTLSQTSPGFIFTNHSQDYSLSFSLRFSNLNVTQLLIG